LNLYRRAKLLYPDAASRISESIAITCIQKAEDEAESGDFAAALTSLFEANSESLPGRLGDRIRQRYLDYYAQLVAERVMSLAGQNGWESIGLVPLMGKDSFEGEAVAGHIANSIAQSGGPSVSVRALSMPALRSLIRGEYEGLPHPDRKCLRDYKDATIILGKIDTEIATYAFDVNDKRTQVLQISKNLGPISGTPGFPIWDNLISKRRTNDDFRIDVWTEQTSYRVGDEVEICLKASQDCYVTLVDLQTSGQVYVLLPNRYQQDNLVLADRIYRIPDGSAPFSIHVSGPAGVEGVKAIATRRSVSFGQADSNRPFLSFEQPQSQRTFASAMISTIESMNPSEWDVGEWTFRILD